jgi:hypothetical protein
MTSKSIRYASVATVAVVLVSGFMLSTARAQAGGQPLILDTQTGIHGGAPGNVLQTGPVTGSGMVAARPMASLQELPQQGQQPMVVSPYIEVQPPGQSSGSSSGAGAGRSSQNAYALQQGNASSRSSMGLTPTGSLGIKRGLSSQNGQGSSGSTMTPPK